MAVAAFVAADVLVVIGMGGGGAVVAVAGLAVAAVVDVAAAAAAAAAAVEIEVGLAAAVVGGGWRDCIEVGWDGGTREEIAEVEVVGVGGPTFEIGGEDSHMETFVDRDRNRKRRWMSDVVVAQDAWMMAYRCGREIAREDVDGVVVADVSRLAVGS